MLDLTAGQELGLAALLFGIAIGLWHQYWTYGDSLEAEVVRKWYTRNDPPSSRWMDDEVKYK